MYVPLEQSLQFFSSGAGIDGSEPFKKIDHKYEILDLFCFNWLILYINLHINRYLKTTKKDIKRTNLFFYNLP